MTEPQVDVEKADVGREIWPDVAKGVCIILVVLWHVVTKHYQRVEWDTELPLSGAWGRLGEFLLPLRMPLFFTISGMFAVSALGRPLGVLMQTRIAKFLYLYLVWVLIHTAIMSFTPHIDTARAHDAWQLVEYLTITPTNLWYLYALAVYFAVARLVRPLPQAWILGATLILSAVAAAHLLPEPSNRGQVYQNLFFFLAGVYGRGPLEKLARRASRRTVALWFLAFVCASAVMIGLDAEAWFGVWPVVSIIAVLFGVAAAAVVARRQPRAAAALAYLGRRTLPIYVMHLAVLAVFDQLTRRYDVEPTGVVYAAIEPIVLTAALIGACLLLERILRRAHAGFLFELPTLRRTA